MPPGDPGGGGGGGGGWGGGGGGLVELGEDRPRPALLDRLLRHRRLAASSTGRAAARVGDTKTDVSLTRLPLTRDSPPPSMSTASSVAVAGAAAGLAVAVVVAGG